MNLLIIMILVVQVVGVLTILHFNTKVKGVERDNKRLQRMVKTGKVVENKPIWEELGLTQEEYDQTRNMVYAIDSPKIPLYTPGLDDVYPTTNVVTQSVIEGDSDYKPVQLPKTELGDLLGIDDANELEELQNLIEEQQRNVNLPKKEDVFIEQTPVSVENVEEDLILLMNEIENQITEEPLLPSNIPVEVIPVGTESDFFDEIVKSINDEEMDATLLFSDNLHTPGFILQDSEEILPSDDDAPLIDDRDNENDIEEQSRMIQILNLLDAESTRMDEEFDITDELNDKTLAKQEIQSKLAALSSEEGKNNLKEIILLLVQLYELEGKEEDMKQLKAEYKEYFEDNTIPIKVYEEDIISTDTIEIDNEETFDIPQKYLWMASAKISDRIQGEQRWLGRIIGLSSGGEVSFIHFKDVSQRIWINVSTLDESLIKKLDKGDLLTIFVEREGDSIIAKDVQPLKKALI